MLYAINFFIVRTIPSSFNRNIFYFLVGISSPEGLTLWEDPDGAHPAGIVISMKLRRKKK